MRERIGYKVVTANMRSLGLRKNPNILTFLQDGWVKLPKSQIKKGKDDWGGIWVAAKRSGAKTLQRYMLEQYDQKCKIYKARLGSVLYENSYRIKTSAVFLEEEIS